MTTRDEFLQMMISELNRQKEEDEFVLRRRCSPDEVHRKLCFDFPSVTILEINILTESIEQYLSSSTSSPSSSNSLHVSLNGKFLDNLVFLNSCQQSVDDPAFAQAVASLCATIFLKLPIYLLNCCNEAELYRLLFRQHAALVSEGREDEWDDGEGGGFAFRRTDSSSSRASSSSSSSSPSSFSWPEMFARFKSFVLTGSASLVSGAIRVGVGVGVSKGHLLWMCDFLTALAPLVDCVSSEEDVDCAKSHPKEDAPL